MERDVLRLDDPGGSGGMQGPSVAMRRDRTRKAVSGNSFGELKQLLPFCGSFLVTANLPGHGVDHLFYEWAPENLQRISC